jgi:transglutaminase-like putative cysteine protease
MLKLEEGWLTVLLLCAMLVMAAGGVAAAGWAEGLNAAWVTGIVAVLAGLALAKSRFSGGTAFLFATVYGLFTVGFFIGLGLEGDWHSRSVELVVRLNGFLYKVLYGGTSRDALPFPVAVALIFWYIGVLMSWSVFRRGSVWPAIIPAGVGLLVNAYYYLGPVRLDLYLAVYVLLALLFVARMNLLAREREWQSARVSYSTDLRIDFLRAGLAAALLGVIIGWAGPGLAASPQAATTWRQMTGSFSVVRESWMRMFAAIRGYGQAYSDFYGDSLVLGGPARLSAAPIMDIRVNQPEDERVDLPQAAVPRYYWRAAAYGHYADGSWDLSEVVYKEHDPNRSRVQAFPYLLRRQVSLAVTMHVAASSRLYVAPQLLWVDRPSTLEVTFDPDNGVQYDISAVRSQQVLRRGETYQMVASVSIADDESLRQASTNYPAWVRSNFLTLPPEITPRTRALAQQIVDEAGADNPYDQAVAITQWLRDNIVYDQAIDVPPADVEPIDYLLFTSRRGYCNYYASAEVMLLRSLGIPARLAVGFSQGDADPRTGVFHVLEHNAHAWPEVFFPQYGWVEFEPTTSESPLVRPERSADGSVSPVDPQAGDDDLERGRDGGLLLPEEMEGLDLGQGNGVSTWVNNAMARVPWTALGVAGGAVLAVGLVSGLFALRAGAIGWENLGGLGTWVMRRRGLRLPSAVALVYMQFERAARWLGLDTSGAVTPYERAAAVGAALPEAQTGVDTLTREYVTEQYSPRPPDIPAAHRAWLSIRLQVWHDALRAYLLDLLEEEPEARKSRLAGIADPSEIP